ncbi:MAG: hypothetical protein QXF12_00385 [Candidatus Aenigmatarchaeota archaeon]
MTNIKTILLLPKLKEAAEHYKKTETVAEQKHAISDDLFEVNDYFIQNSYGQIVLNMIRNKYESFGELSDEDKERKVIVDKKIYDDSNKFVNQILKLLDGDYIINIPVYNWDSVDYENKILYTGSLGGVYFNDFDSFELELSTTINKITFSSILLHLEKVKSNTINEKFGYIFIVNAANQGLVTSSAYNYLHFVMNREARWLYGIIKGLLDSGMHFDAEKFFSVIIKYVNPYLHTRIFSFIYGILNIMQYFYKVSAGTKYKDISDNIDNNIKIFSCLLTSLFEIDLENDLPYDNSYYSEMSDLETYVVFHEKVKSQKSGNVKTVNIVGGTANPQKPAKAIDSLINLLEEIGNIPINHPFWRFATSNIDIIYAIKDSALYLMHKVKRKKS